MPANGNTKKYSQATSSLCTKSIFDTRLREMKGPPSQPWIPCCNERVQLPILGFCVAKRSLIIIYTLWLKCPVKKKTNTHIACEISGKEAIN